jgi:hypothetical protein
VSDLQGTDGQDTGILKEVPLLGPYDNPHEVVVAKCAKCFEQTVTSRRELEIWEWRRLVEPRLQDHPGFMLCPVHHGEQFTWEDLY